LHLEPLNLFLYCIESELTKIALVHLYSQGFTDEKLVDFTLELTTASIVYEQEKTELYGAKMDVASAMLDNKVMSRDWVYENLFGLSPDQYNKEKDLMVQDAMQNFRVSQIENEGNDPSESVESYGTPHDFASLYGNKRDKGVGPNQVPTGYDENPVGPPKQSVSNYGTEASNFSRDPLGKQGTKADIAAESYNPSKSVYHGLKSSLQKIKKEKQILKEGDDNGLLSEKNIKSEE
jgi:hypothetical protein